MAETKCPGCNKQARPTSRSESVIQCAICEAYWHSACSDEETKKYYNVIMNSTNLIWNCKFCIGKKDEFLSALKTFKNIESVTAKMSERIVQHDDLFKKVEEKLNALNKLKDSMDRLMASTNEHATPKRTFANMVANSGSWGETPLTSKRKKTFDSNKKSEKKESVNVIVVKTKENEKDTVTNRRDVERIFDPTIDPILQIKSTTRGKTLVFCKDSDALEKVKEKLVKSIGQKYQIDEPRSHKPRLKVIGDIDPDYDIAKITECIKHQNGIVLPFVVEKLKRKQNYTYFEISCCFKLFTYLMDVGRISVGWCKAKVYEFIPATMCFKCNKFGHIESECNSEVFICPKCSGPHTIKQCTSSVLSCPNCCEKNLKYNTKRPVDHLPWSYRCPGYAKKAETIKKRINYEK